MRVLVTCPPMLAQIQQFEHRFAELGWQVSAPEVTQTLSEEALIELVAAHDGWIIGDDPATARVVAAGKAGLLKGAVKWGVGIDNVDFDAFAAQGIPVTNTPGMFGREVADVALGYVIALARHTFEIHQGVLEGQWPKPTGTSLAGKTCALVGFGDIGAQLGRRLETCEMTLQIYDPAAAGDVRARKWPQDLEACDFICFTCALNDQTRHMLNGQVLSEHCKDGVRVVNVARGPLIDEKALIGALNDGKVAAAALDVFEVEPLPASSPLRHFPQNIFGTHNGSNSKEVVMATSYRAIDLLREALS